MASQRDAPTVGVLTVGADGAKVGAPSERGRLAAQVGLGVALVALCAAFHLWRMAQTPGWDPQEGYNLDLAWNLLHGRLRLFALTQDFAQHPPLYYFQLALAIRVFGYGITAARALAALYATLSCLALLLVGRRMLGMEAALWAAAAYTVAPVMLTNTRWGYSYGLLALVGLAVIWLGWESLTAADGARGRRWLYIAAVGAGVAAYSDYVGVAWIALVALAGLKWGWRPALAALGIGAGTLALGLLALLAVSPGVFLADVTSTGARAAGGNPITQALVLLLNYERFLTVDAWLLLGVVGLFLVRRTPARGYVLGAVGLLGLLILKTRTVGPSLHTVTPLLPLLALGAGVALAAATGALFTWAAGWLAPLDGWLARRRGDVEGKSPARTRLSQVLTALLVFVVIGSPLAMAGASDAVGLAGRLTTPQDALLATPTDAAAAQRYILTHARAGDLVLASPQIAWAFDDPENIHGRPSGVEGADITQTVAYAGQAAAFYPAGLPRNRWAYDASLGRARYVVVDDLIRALAAPGELPRLTPMLAQVERWPVVFRSGQYVIYEQPSL
ncbi:MAG TPA: glycosyltransferase family 39 protein [Ktedonobacterales bacterium]|nr:glycosyltransferase family 39 protein [Ktedonobacterales bacterium]